MDLFALIRESCVVYFSQISLIHADTHYRTKTKNYEQLLYNINILLPANRLIQWGDEVIMRERDEAEEWMKKKSEIGCQRSEMWKTMFVNCFAGGKTWQHRQPPVCQRLREGKTMEWQYDSTKVRKKEGAKVQ